MRLNDKPLKVWDFTNAKDVKIIGPCSLITVLAVRLWNTYVPVGTPVQVMMDKGEVLNTVTRAQAGILACGYAVVWVEGIAGWVPLERVFPRVG